MRRYLPAFGLSLAVLACGSRSELFADTTSSTASTVATSSAAATTSGTESGTTSATASSSTGCGVCIVGARVLLFGGATDGPAGFLNDTWSWDGASWTERMVSGPPARAATGVASFDGQVELFGGVGNGALFDDTWTWDGVSWNEPEISGPSARVGASTAPMLDGGVVLFGGSGDGGAVLLGDTWVWDNETWSGVPVSGPSGRDGAAMALLGTKVVLFGGVRYPPCPRGVLVRYVDLGWRDVDGYERRRTSCAGRRCDGAYRRRSRSLRRHRAKRRSRRHVDLSLRYVDLGRRSVGPEPPWGRRHASPTPWLHSRGGLLLFGGEGPETLLNDTWIWNGVSWTEENLNGPTPAARYQAAIGATL